MTGNDAHDADATLLSGLAPLASDPERAERVRRQCRARLKRGRRREAPALMLRLSSRLLAPVLLGGFCVFYVLALLATTLRLEGIVR